MSVLKNYARQQKYLGSHFEVEEVKEGRKIPEPHGKELLSVLYTTFDTPEPQKVGA
jgi:hypothetical protein